MKKLFYAACVVILLITIIAVIENTFSQEIEKEDCYFLSSLHYTTNGMQHWYSKENGGLEVITGIPYDSLGCKNCHTPGCDVCHKIEKNEKFAYSTEISKSQTICLKCHGRTRSMLKIDKAVNQQDVHFERGMQCMDCHTAREMHGDGVKYASLEQPGAMDTKCENCHEEIDSTNAHTVHGEKLDCKACHLRHVVSCTNCHFDTFVKTEKKKSIKVSGWLFLINNKGKVTSANMQTFVVDNNKTFFMFAPHMSHSIMSEGRKCDECHRTKIVKQVQQGKLKLTWLKNENLQNLKGVIPVVDETDYQCVYMNYEEGKWVPIKNPTEPIYHYPAFGKPLSKKQLESLARR